ncbi:hypothetical protein BASA81_000708 [Batrachochytrium salamandrivorans]|nr:hypothetical protein BASA81_000708 [Batrachochytrium salamandrivorans]
MVGGDWVRDVEEGVEAVSRPGNGVAEWILFASKIGDELLQVLLSGACTHANNHMALLEFVYDAALGDKHRLTPHFSLRGNKISLQGAKAIATALQHPNNHIRELK